jgi:hypothetical protein
MTFLADKCLIIGFCMALASRGLQVAQKPRGWLGQTVEIAYGFFLMSGPPNHVAAFTSCVYPRCNQPRGRAFPLKALWPPINEVLTAVGLMYPLASKLIYVIGYPILAIRIDVQHEKA